MKYEPHGEVDLEDQSSGHPWIAFIFWCIAILGIWYEESYTIKEAFKNQNGYSWEEPVKLSWNKRCGIILKCLIIDVKNNPRCTLGCSAFILYLLVRCFI